MSELKHVSSRVQSRFAYRVGKKPEAYDYREESPPRDIDYHSSQSTHQSDSAPDKYDYSEREGPEAKSFHNIHLLNPFELC